MKVAYNAAGVIDTHYYPYTVKGEAVAYKKRTLPKDFRVVGDLKHKGLELFGQSKFQGGGFKLVITEGELDAIAVQQAMLTKYLEIVSAVFNARKYAPASIVRGEAIWEAYLERKETESVPYPKCLEGLNDKLDGMRKGEIVLFTSGTGSGKSTMIKEIVLEVLGSTSDSIGMVSLEESIGDSAEKFIKMFAPANPTQEEERSAYEMVFGNERLVLLDHNGAVSDSSLIDQIENLCLLGCEYIILDHITIGCWG